MSHPAPRPSHEPDRTLVLDYTRPPAERQMRPAVVRLLDLLDLLEPPHPAADAPPRGG